jgi:hypothetical protein
VDAEVEEIRQRLVDALDLGRDFGATSKVFELRLAQLASPERRTGIISCLDWVLQRGF